MIYMMYKTSFPQQAVDIKGFFSGTMGYEQTSMLHAQTTMVHEQKPIIQKHMNVIQKQTRCHGTWSDEVGM